MSKELEALERYHRLDVLVETDKDLILKDEEEYKILKQALQHLEFIDNAKPSRALEVLSENIICIHVGHYQIIKQALLKAQEQEKALNIIRASNVDIIYLKESNNVEEYNSHFGAVVCKLTPEEYDAVKRYFK